MPDRTKTKRGYKWSDQHLNDFLDTTTIAGIFHIFRGRSNIRRLIWAIVFIGSVIGCLVLVGFSFANFFDKPTASTITVTSSEENGLLFPAITICNLNIRQNYSDILSNETYQFLNFLFNSDEDFLLHSQGHNTSYVIEECNRRLYNITEIGREIEIWKAISSADNLIHYCGFSLGAGSEVVSCGDIFQPVLTAAGICHTYNGIRNGKPDQIVTTTGVRYGLKLILNIDQEIHPSFDGLSGVKVVVHERNDIARPNLYGISVSPGQNVDIAVRKAIRIDETEQANCIYDRNLEFLPRFQYSQFACRDNTLLEHIAQENVCGCILTPDRPTSGSYVNTPNCTFSELCCLVNEYATYDQNNDCPLPCRFENYQYENSYSSFPTGHFLNDFATSLNMSHEIVKDNFLSVHIYIEDLEVTTSITKYTFGPVSLLADIGGQLGLFLGISIISMIEVLILILDELKKLCITEKCERKLDKIDVNLPTVNVAPEEKETEV